MAPLTRATRTTGNMHFPRTNVVRAILAAGALAGGAGVVANTQQAVELPTPVLSLSTLTMATRDSVAVIIVYSNRCSAGGFCPSQWRVAATAGDEKLGHTRKTLRDTMRVAKPVCPATLAVKAAVIADLVRATGETISSRAASASLPIVCRAQTAAEKAELDSFPSANRKIMLGTNWMFRTLNNVKDSVYTVQDKPGEISVPLGYTMGPLCILKRNRYTGRVDVEGPDPALRCEAVRKAFESARDS